jgi:predicted DCC family thiol-disulfide oxidoreductase YuxK
MKPVLFYDGDCALCNHSVIFLLKIDKSEVLRYAALDSDIAQNLLGDDYHSIRQIDSVTLLVKDKIFVESGAIIESLLLINQWKWLAYVLRPIPQFIRNGIYRWIARHRSKIFSSCPVIPPEYSHLFLKR